MNVRWCDDVDGGACLTFATFSWQLQTVARYQRKLTKIAPSTGHGMVHAGMESQRNGGWWWS
jgi:hypothetical protein